MRKEETLYGCLRCGTQRPRLHKEDNTICTECGEQGIVTFQQALDMLNEVHRKNKKEVETLFDLDEYYIIEAEVE